MTIKHTLISSTLIIIFSSLILGALNIYGYKHVISKASLANDFDKEVMYLQMMLRGLNEVIINDGTPESIHVTEKGLNNFEALHTKILRNIQNPEILRTLVEDVSPKWQIIKREITPFLSHYLDVEDEEGMRQVGQLITTTEGVIKIIEEIAETTRDIVNKNSKKSAIIEKFILVVLFTVLFVFAFLSRHVYRSITHPIKELTTIAEGFQKGDLSIMMDESRQDEFGSLARYFNRSTTELSETTQELKSHSAKLTKLNKQLNEEVVERLQAEERIKYMAYHDDLTGLPNRYLFKDRLNVYLNQAARYQKKGAVLFLDIDNFKNINDSLGHTMGDLLLKEVASSLRLSVRASDSVTRQMLFDDKNSTISRLGGDEFTILLTDIESSLDAVKVAQRIMTNMSEPFKLEDNEVFVSISIGIAICPDDGDNVESLLKNADTALFHAKKVGKNNYQFYKAFMNATAQKRLIMESELHKAIDNNEMELYYQPRVHVATGNIVSLEALLRWQCPNKGFIPPFEFIPVAEDTGIIIPLGEWVLNTACRQKKAWEVAGLPPFSVSVNISGKQLQKDNILQTISGALKNSLVNPNQLELEITENVLMNNAKKTIDMISELKEMGLKLSMDDFGTGYSSFSYLQQFALDVIKIDRAFIKDIPDNTGSAAIVTAIISMAHSLNLTVVAEGVETKEQLDFLANCGCDEIQGYYFSKPLPTDQITALLNNSMNMYSGLKA